MPMTKMIGLHTETSGFENFDSTTFLHKRMTSVVLNSLHAVNFLQPVERGRPSVTTLKVLIV